MPANNRSTKSSAKASKKVASKISARSGKKVTGNNTAKAVTKVARKAPARAKPSRRAVAAMPAEPRHEMIAKAAYYRAQRRNFQDGDPLADWFFAEKEVDALLNNAANRT